jgi:hypothetical protein
MAATVRMAPGWRQALARESHAARLGAIRHAEETAVRVCPVDTGALRHTIEGEADRDSMACRLSAGDALVDYAAVVEVGGAPHRIASHGPWPLRNRETGQVFGPVVNHPGTPAQPYLRPGVLAVGSYTS